MMYVCMKGQLEPKSRGGAALHTSKSFKKPVQTKFPMAEMLHEKLPTGLVKQKYVLFPVIPRGPKL